MDPLIPCIVDKKKQEQVNKNVPSKTEVLKGKNHKSVNKNGMIKLKNSEKNGVGLE